MVHIMSINGNLKSNDLLIKLKAYLKSNFKYDASLDMKIMKRL